MHFTYPVTGIFSTLSSSDAISIIFKCSILYSKDCLVCNLISKCTTNALIFRQKATELQGAMLDVFSTQFDVFIIFQVSFILI